MSTLGIEHGPSVGGECSYHCAIPALQQQFEGIRLDRNYCRSPVQINLVFFFLYNFWHRDMRSLEQTILPDPKSSSNWCKLVLVIKRDVDKSFFQKKKY